MSSSPASLLPGPAALSIAELSAARLDGELYPIADAFCPVDLPAFPAVRAGAVLALLPAHAFAERLSAAWLHGALPHPPALNQFALPAGLGTRPERSRAHALRQVAVSPGDLTLVGGCPVTTRLRTLVDLLLDDGLDDAEALALAATLGAAEAITPAAARASLRARPPLPNRLLAERRLTALGGASRR